MNDNETEKSKLTRRIDTCLEDCQELKTYVKEFLEASGEIYKNTNDAIILRQVAGLKKKVNK